MTPRGRPRSGADLTVAVLAGGASSRFGGDKLAAELDGVTVLDRLLTGLPAGPVIAVGSPRQTDRSVSWVREEPPDGGPLAGVDAALRAVATELVAVVAGDMPYAGPAVPVLREALDAAGSGVGAAVGVDDEGHVNPLLAVYRAAAVRAVLTGGSRGRAARRLLDVPHVGVRVPGVASRDVDTREDLHSLRRHRGGA